MKRIMVFFLSVMLMLSCLSCTKKAKTEADIELWSAISTEKILSDKTYTDTQKAVLSYEMCKNEVEGAQFIITPKNGYKVKSFNVEVSDLKTAENDVISKNNIEVYLQKYINVYENQTSNPNKQTGYHPDGLLPFGKAVEYKENKVEKINQGVYIDVTTEKDTVAGNYKGTCKVTVDGNLYEVPMQVTVWDFGIDDEVHVKSLFSIWLSQLMYSELDSSNEMMKAYSDALNKYRLSSDKLIYTDWEDYIQKAKEATKNPKITSYNIPYSGAANAELGASLDYVKQKFYLKDLVLNSTEDCCLIDKLVYYFGALIDEPQYDSTGKLNRMVKQIADRCNEIEIEVYNEVDDEGYFDDKSDEYKKHIKDTITAIPNIVTGPYNSSYTPGSVTYCPLFDEMNSDSNRELYQHEGEENKNLWWYGCTGPNYPNPTYHIDDSLLAARILDYMMYDYGIQGNLYWCVNYMFYIPDAKTGNLTRPVNAYEEVKRDGRKGGINGDGYLFYPGIDYGMKSPIGTIRLEAIRDGNEEYEYLYQLDKMATSVSKYYNAKIDANEMVSNLYSRLYKGTKYVLDDENYFQVRRELAETIESLNSDEKFVNSGISFSGSKAKIDFYAAGDYSVEVNCVSLNGIDSGEGKKYSFEKELDENSNYFTIKFTKGDKTITRTIFIGGKTVVANNFDSEALTSLFKANDKTVKLIYNDESDYAISGGSLKAIITSKFDANNPLSTLSYYPEISVDMSDINCDAMKTSQVTLMIYNSGVENIEMSVYLGADANRYKFSTYNLKKGEWNTIRLENLYLTNWGHLKNTNKLIFRFKNTVNDENKIPMKLQTIYFDNLLISNKVSD